MGYWRSCSNAHYLDAKLRRSSLALAKYPYARLTRSSLALANYLDATLIRSSLALADYFDATLIRSSLALADYLDATLAGSSLVIANYLDDMLTTSPLALVNNLDATLTRSSLALATRTKASLVGAHGGKSKIRFHRAFILERKTGSAKIWWPTCGGGSGAQGTAETACWEQLPGNFKSKWTCEGKKWSWPTNCSKTVVKRDD